MKIGIITRHLGLPVGFGTYAGKLLEGLAAVDKQNDYVVYTATPPPKRRWPARFRFKRFAVEQRRSKLTWWEHTTAPLAAKGDGVDLVHYLHTATPLPPVRRPVLTGVLDAIEWAEPGYRRSRHYDLLARRDIRLANHILTISEHAKRDLNRLLKVPLDKISVTHLAGPKVESSAGRKKAYWLFVGGVEKRKDLRSTIEAFAELDDPRMRLKVVGPTNPSPIHDDRAELVALLALDQRARVDWLGRVSDSELARLYREATALVFPSVYEGFGLPVLEAFARRTPVIAANASSIPEIAGDAAILVPPRDPAALADAMRQVRTDAALRRRMASRGAEQAAVFSWKQTARDTVAVYERMLS